MQLLKGHLLHEATGSPRPPPFSSLSNPVLFCRPQGLGFLRANSWQAEEMCLIHFLLPQ